MAEITRVPLKPVSRNSLVMLFVGILIGLALAGAAAWLNAPKGVDVDVVTAGTGENPGADDIVFMHYTGKLEDGTVFDQSQPQPLPIEGIFPEGTPLQLSQVVPGFREGVMKMQKGGKYVLTIPAEKGYGDNPPPGSPIKPGSNLVFDVEIVDFMSLEEANKRVAQIQEMMMKQGGLPGAPGAQGGAQGAEDAHAPAVNEPLPPVQ